MPSRRRRGKVFAAIRNATGIQERFSYSKDARICGSTHAIMGFFSFLACQAAIAFASFDSNGSFL